ncbi:MAG: hypothetical protein AAF708_01710 [Deinococcota bacterium]
MTDKLQRNVPTKINTYNIPVHTVSDQRAAKSLLDGNERRWFVPFLGQACTVSAAAKQLNETPNSVLYRVKRWLDLGLLTVDHEEQRAGRIIKHYRAVAEGFFVPFEASSEAGLLELMWYTNKPYLDDLFNGMVGSASHLSETWGVQISKVGEAVRVEAALSAGQVFNPRDHAVPAVFEQFATLKLSFEDAKLMQQELLELLNKYRAKEGEQTYLSYLALTPTAPKDSET